MIEPLSCLNKDPFIRLGDGQAPVLNYNLPQETCFKVYGRIPFVVPREYFRKEASNIPPVNFWDLFKDKYETEIISELNGQLMNGGFGSGISSNLRPIANKVTMNAASAGKVSATVTVKDAVSSPKVEQPVQNSNINTGKVKDVSVEYIARQISRGLQPVSYKRFDGDYDIYYIPKPSKPTPQIFIVETYSVCSYLGDYGAGKNLNVVSLLPGEKTVITIKTYQEKESTETKSENILDSFSESSSQEFEELLKEETGQTENSSKNSGFSLDLSKIVTSVMPIEGGGETTETSSGAFGYKSDKTNTTTSNVNNIQQTISKQVETSSLSREIEVNLTSSETIKTGEETSIVRTLENINRSRVLNIVFRQLLQEYITLVSLTDVKIIYTNGYPESNIVMDISELDDKLKDVIVAEKVKEVRDEIIKDYCTVYNYLGHPKKFLERVVEDYHDCECLNLSKKKVFCRINKDLVDEAEGISTHGVILSVKKRILRTPSVIADALLGQGEALDCYNMQLQKAAVDKANLENEKSKLALDIINSITDPEKKAAMYASFFNKPCCDDCASDTQA